LKARCSVRLAIPAASASWMSSAAMCGAPFCTFSRKKAGRWRVFQAGGYQTAPRAKAAPRPFVAPGPHQHGARQPHGWPAVQTGAAVAVDAVVRSCKKLP
jgi:hypothetical protein